MLFESSHQILTRGRNQMYNYHSTCIAFLYDSKDILYISNEGGYHAQIKTKGTVNDIKNIYGRKI